MSIYITLLTLILLSYSNQQETLADCTGVTNPTKEEDCSAKSQKEEDVVTINCCFATITSEGNDKDKNFCIPIQQNFTFALPYLTGISYGTYSNVDVKFSCMTEKNSCGTGNPKKLFQCREHSSPSQSCCMITKLQDGKREWSDCILSNDKFEKEHDANANETKVFFDDYTVVCQGHTVTYKIFYLLTTLLFFILL